MSLPAFELCTEQMQLAIKVGKTDLDVYAPFLWLYYT